MSLSRSRATGRSNPSHLGIARRSHAWFLAGELLLLVAMVALSLLVKRHLGPFPGDIGLELDVQHALLPHQSLVVPVEGVSTLNWPVPAAISLGIISVFFLILRRWLDTIVVLVTAGITSWSSAVLSRWVHRPRPFGHGIHATHLIKSTFSFPSGHVTYAVCVFGLFLFLTFQVRRALHPAFILILRIFLIALIVLMPISRLLEGQHWPSDLLGGVIYGAFWLILAAHVYLWARDRWPRLLAADER